MCQDWAKEVERQKEMKQTLALLFQQSTNAQPFNAHRFRPSHPLDSTPSLRQDRAKEVERLKEKKQTLVATRADKEKRVRGLGSLPAGEVALLVLTLHSPLSATQSGAASTAEIEPRAFSTMA